ncbi:MAB_1171c family putative transporter [Streptomyces mirabilis]|uniref:MAB_1171c family putative transporter n=1 Tax=Streptomyces mirabilis TaxID=68239 RepID=UPI00371FAE2E
MALLLGVQDVAAGPIVPVRRGGRDAASRDGAGGQVSVLVALGGRVDGNHDPVEVGHVPAVDAEAFDFEHPALPQSAAWRVTRPGKSPQQRPLTVALAALSVVAALGEPHIDTLLNRLGLTAEHLLFKHLTGIVAAGSVLDFVANMADRGTDPHSRRICYGPGGLTGTITIAVSPFIPRGPSDRGFELTNTDQTSVFLYWVFWLGYLGTAVVLATRLCCEQVRAASPGRLRLGLDIIGTGTAIGCGYILNKLAFVALGYLPWLRLPLSGPRTEMINDFLLYTSLFLSVAGTTVPTPLASCMASPILRLQEQRDLELLRPLWLALTRSRPDVVLREVPKGNTRLQRYRCVIEIDDAALTLQEYRQPEMEKAARGRTECGTKCRRGGRLCRSSPAGSRTQRRASATGRCSPPTIPPRTARTSSPTSAAYGS